MKKIFMLLVVALLANSSLWAFKREIVTIHSDAMNKDINATVILPDGYKRAKKLTTVYLLHGFSGNYKEWDELGKASPLADKHNVIIVMTDGGYDSWYWDSPVVPTNRYETFISKEVVEYIDSHYKTIADRSGRAIAGLSMGGHGALYLAIRHQDTYGAAGSMSGGVDIRPFPRNWGMSKWIGTIAENPQNWEDYTVINMIDRLKPNHTRLIIDCGTEDFFYKVNCNLHAKLLEAKIPHDFYVRPGAHNWAYWRNSIKFQLLFFANFFEEGRAAEQTTTKK